MIGKVKVCYTASHMDSTGRGRNVEEYMHKIRIFSHSSIELALGVSVSRPSI